MANKTYKIGVIGNRDAILPFRMLGFQTFAVIEVQDAINKLRQLANDDFGVIFLTEDMAEQMSDTIAYYDKQVKPALILIPTHKGSLGIGLKRIQENVEKAVGQNILQEK
ncbi:V-type ATP synthase subunit F [Streptococcus didelphis]|uniref:V-type ATP synthase subunit F n=1 Tax=Streptococcus didelphis TaxID=102886 RepID=A0ABY9LHU0_9STRE|nr:V-type ATP synthase subunit F [Streptococcus didelphis]WMB28384.1 V-type ATP synthase subunit F [Streptococcus didelphis]WMB29069.1 V-type ATP synthase subunit F [Streptococcus didelphis]